MTTGTTTYSPTEEFALQMDQDDPLRDARDLFELPDSPAGDGQRAAYFTGNSLGCMPKATRVALQTELDDWGRLAVDGHFEANTPWVNYHECLREGAEKIVGAKKGAGEVVMMNSLTANLHFMMVSFYRPTSSRYKIIIEDDCFPSDSYAVQSQAAFHAQYHDFDAADAIIRLKPVQGEHTLRTEDIVATINEHGDSVALVMIGGVNYLTGQFFDINTITAAGRAIGANVGWDLAHAAGNVPLNLHDWNVDFACWCTYKYLNSGPGAVAGCFVHERHVLNTKPVGSDGIPRFLGWWASNPETRFKMNKDCDLTPSADSWQLSNPPIMALAPIKASYEVFSRYGMDLLRAKSLRLTGYLEFLLDQIKSERITILTPRDPDQRGCQLSIAVHHEAKALHEKLHQAGCVTDFRYPNVIRVAPVPLYNSFHDVWRFADVLRNHLA